MTNNVQLWKLQMPKELGLAFLKCRNETSNKKNELSFISGK